jgi:SsrA-binding protein
LAIQLSETGYVKILIGLAKGKKTYDKRNSIKEKDIKRELEKNY